MTELSKQPKITSEILEQTNELITPKDLSELAQLIEQSELHFPSPDRNFIVIKSKRDKEFADKNSSNTTLRRKWVKDNFGIIIENIRTPSDEKLKTRLVGELIYLLATSAMIVSKDPEQAKLLAENINLKISTSTNKHKILEKRRVDQNLQNTTEALKTFTAAGLFIMPNEDPLPPGGLETIRETLETTLKEKQQSQTPSTE